MANKLIKKGRPLTKVTKSINVTDVDGNKAILKATVISVSPKEISKRESAEIVEGGGFESFDIANRIIGPPLSLAELSILSDFSTELGQTIEALEVGIEGFGGRLKLREMTEEQQKKNQKQIDEEEQFLIGLMKYPNPEESFTKLRKGTRKNLELTGNAWWELVPSRKNAKRYSCITSIKSGQVFITKSDKDFTKTDRFFVDKELKTQKRTFMRRMRRFVQIVGNKKVYWKEFGDPRIIDRRTGDVAGKSLAENKRASELFHFKIPTARKTPYGMPRFTGNIISVKGSRQSDETNLLTLMNNNVPSMAVILNGGMLTEGSVKRIQEFVDIQIKGSSNYSKFLILEGEAAHDGLSTPGSMKIDIKPLTGAQHSDQLWQSYDKNNADKTRRSWRLPPMMTGNMNNLNRSVAQESERIAEKYIYNPEREGMDESINTMILQQGIKFWEFKSNSPNVTNDEDLVKILSGAEKTGGMTPRIAREMLEDVLNKKLPAVDENIPDEFKEFFHPDIPFSLSLAMLMHSAGAANANGTNEPQGQTPKAPGKVLEDKMNPHAVLYQMMDDPDNMITKLSKVRDELGIILGEEAGYYAEPKPTPKKRKNL